MQPAWLQLEGSVDVFYPTPKVSNTVGRLRAPLTTPGASARAVGCGHKCVGVVDLLGAAAL